MKDQEVRFVSIPEKISHANCVDLPKPVEFTPLNEKARRSLKEMFEEIESERLQKNSAPLKESALDLEDLEALENQFGVRTMVGAVQLILIAPLTEKFNLIPYVKLHKAVDRYFACGYRLGDQALPECIDIQDPYINWMMSGPAIQSRTPAPETAR